MQNKLDMNLNILQGLNESLQNLEHFELYHFDNFFENVNGKSTYAFEKLKSF